MAELPPFCPAMTLDGSGRFLVKPEDVSDPRFEPFLSWDEDAEAFSLPESNMMLMPRPHWKHVEMFRRNLPKFNALLGRLEVKVTYAFNPDALAVAMPWGELVKLWNIHKTVDDAAPQRRYLVERKEVVVTRYEVIASCPSEAKRIIREMPEKATQVNGAVAERIWFNVGKQKQ